MPRLTYVPILIPDASDLADYDGAFADDTGVYCVGNVDLAMDDGVDLASPADSHHSLSPNDSTQARYSPAVLDITTALGFVSPLTSPDNSPRSLYGAQNLSSLSLASSHSHSQSRSHSRNGSASGHSRHGSSTGDLLHANSLSRNTSPIGSPSTSPRGSLRGVGRHHPYGNSSHNVAPHQNTSPTVEAPFATPLLLNGVPVNGFADNIGVTANTTPSTAGPWTPADAWDAASFSLTASNAPPHPSIYAETSSVASSTRSSLADLSSVTGGVIDLTPDVNLGTTPTPATYMCAPCASGQCSAASSSVNRNLATFVPQPLAPSFMFPPPPPPCPVHGNSFPQGAPQMPRAGWTGAMWAASTAAAQQGQAGAGGVDPQQQQPYAQPGHPGQQFSAQQQFPGQPQQYAQQPAQYAQPGQPIYDPSAQYQQQYPTAAGPSQQQPPYAGAPQYQYPQQYPPQQQQQQFAPAAGQGYDVSAQPQAAYPGYAPPGGQQWTQQPGMTPGLLQMSSTGQYLGSRSDDKPVAPQRACTRCKRLKVRCEPVNGERPCKRCRNANAECETAPRKQRPKYGYGGSEDEEEQKADKERAARLAAEAEAGHRVGDRSQRGDTPSSPEASEDEEDDEDSDEWLDPNQTEGPPDGVKAPFQFIRDGVPNRHKHAANVTSPPVGAPSSPTSSAASGRKDKEGTKLLRPGYFNADSAASIPLANVPGIDKLEILGVLTTAEIDMLFRQFMSKMNPYMSMFDEKLHTVEYVKERSPFLLSVIAMIASRYYTNRPDAYVRLMDITKKLAGEAIINMTKSIEHVQAFILLASYPAPDRKYSENKNWLYSGVAFRMATDLGLYKHQPLPAATATLEREALNRTRTWIVCFYLDESMSAHFGRPATIARDDAVVKNAMNWWHANQGRYAHLHDVHLVVFVDLLRAFRTALEKVEKSKENESEPDVDYDRICREFDEEVAGLVAKSNALFEQYTDRTNPVCVLRERMGDFTTQYSRLIIHSTAFQKGRHQTPELEQACLSKCLQSAFRVLEILMNDLASTGLLRYACDGYFWYASFASAFLLKFLGAEHHDMVDDRTREQIVIRVRELIEVLGSRAVAVDGSHPPKLFSRFLNGMLSKHVRQAKRVASSAGSSAGTPRHADSISTGGGTADEASEAGTFSPATPSSELGSTPATSPVASTGSASSIGHVAHALVETLPDQSPHVMTQQWAAQTQHPDLFGAGFAPDPWAIAHETLMEDVGQQELFTGMFILDHPPWWTDPSLSIDMAAMGMASAGDAGASAAPGGGTDALGAGGHGDFAAYDSQQYGGA